MSETKFTTGPWSTRKHERQIVICGNEGLYDIAIVRKIGGEDNDANANLIAAAPCMYEALEELAGVAIRFGIPTDKADSVLAQARGATDAC